MADPVWLMLFALCTMASSKKSRQFVNIGGGDVSENYLIIGNVIIIK